MTVPVGVACSRVELGGRGPPHERKPMSASPNTRVEASSAAGPEVVAGAHATARESAAKDSATDVALYRHAKRTRCGSAMVSVAINSRTVSCAYSSKDITTCSSRRPRPETGAPRPCVAWRGSLGRTM